MKKAYKKTLEKNSFFDWPKINQFTLDTKITGQTGSNFAHMILMILSYSFSSLDKLRSKLNVLQLIKNAHDLPQVASVTWGKSCAPYIKNYKLYKDKEWCRAVSLEVFHIKISLTNSNRIEKKIYAEMMFYYPGKNKESLIKSTIFDGAP